MTSILGIMKRRQVVSSTLKSVGYDAATHTLEVELIQGDVFDYYEVPEDLYRTFMNTESRGSFYFANIRDAGFNFDKIK